MTGDYKNGRSKSNQYAAAFRERNGGAAAETTNRNHRLSEASGVSYLANHLKQTASFDFDKFDEENNENIGIGDSLCYSGSKTDGRGSLEENYSRAMRSMNRGDFDPNRKKMSVEKNGLHKRSSRGSANSGKSKREEQSRHSSISSNTNTDSTLADRSRSSSRRESESTAKTRLSKTKTNVDIKTTVKTTKKSASNKDPSEETIAIFGVNGVTGHHFLQRAMEAGYKIQLLNSSGMDMNNVTGNENLKIVTGSLDEIEKIREVVDNASYVVCLLNDCGNQEIVKPPLGNMEDETESSSYFNLNFVHNLVPILEKSETCRVMLYEASSMALDAKGSAPFFTKMVKKMAFRKNWRSTKREQDRIVQYIASQTKDASFNYIVTRPSAAFIWDRPSRKKLAASKSQPGPFPITNTDLAEFTLSALRMDKIYNSCPYVVQDGI
mmetsp:Transcript_2196/g.4699  ORF Transcript_2196/g.4699 Transcript_2196/m.4699 type:complete len:438 (+) Transcript_2196:55-1368(+)|eukprot:CAMPEP_0168194914 /NCGR_PEP_ID=MMETSP0139_2-20121125/19509_1 /TAXON_ID=44445 /ORGANISM="Pseudo-nitzschia australis, Strain 10249 10 AB" /LENGTH=437 /DNA_ID=CAMNT_0008118599 /DNA_START=26 /DNA_END=1339 /DNA_ORIENTATION=-